jgi:hypothetical protein
MPQFDLAGFLQSVAPGYVGLIIFRYLNPGDKPSWEHTLVGSIVYSLLGLSIAQGASGLLYLAEGSEFLLQVPICALLGLLVGLFVRSDWLDGLTAKIGISPTYNVWLRAMRNIGEEWVRIEKPGNSTTYDGKVKLYSVTPVS